jgi:hypothetical protein
MVQIEGKTRTVAVDWKSKCIAVSYNRGKWGGKEGRKEGG